MEMLWVILNLLGVEQTVTGNDVRYVGDIHLAYMPFSHSIVTMMGVAVLAWIIIGKGFGYPDIGIAVGIGVISHLLLDLITHSNDIAIAPFLNGSRYGLGLYAKFPLVAFALEIGYGIGCWWIYRGGLVLLIVIVVVNLANISMFSTAIPGIEKYMANQPLLITSVVLAQILVTLTLVGIFS